MPPVGLEPTATRLRVGCSNQLSYRGFIFARSRRESNPQPPAPEAGALSIELRKQNMRYEIILCPRQELNLRPAGLQPAALTKLSYRGETCAPTRIRASGRRARSSDGGNRTRDHWLMKPALYRLSYARIHTANSALTRYVTLPVFIFVPAVGLEPTPSTVSEWRSHQLNYAGKDENKVTKERPHNTAITCRFGAGSERASRVIERRKLNPRRSSTEPFLFSSVVLPRIELGSPG